MTHQSVDERVRASEAALGSVQNDAQTCSDRDVSRSRKRVHEDREGLKRERSSSVGRLGTK